MRTTSGLASVFLAQATKTTRDGIVPHLPLGTPNHEGLTQCLTSPQTMRSQEGISTATGVRKRRGSLQKAVGSYPISCDGLCPPHCYASQTHPHCAFIFMALSSCTVLGTTSWLPRGYLLVAFECSRLGGCSEPLTRTLGSPLGYMPEERGHWVLRHMCVQLYKLMPSYCPVGVSQSHPPCGSVAGTPQPHPFPMPSERGDYHY